MLTGDPADSECKDGVKREVVNQRHLETVIHEYCLHYKRRAPASEPQLTTANVPQRSYPGGWWADRAAHPPRWPTQRLSLYVGGRVTSFSNPDTKKCQMSQGRCR